MFPNPFVASGMLKLSFHIPGNNSYTTFIVILTVKLRTLDTENEAYDNII